MAANNQPKVYGIDLGTTYSCIAHLDPYGEPEILVNSEGKPTTPSVVYISPDGRNCVVGEIAKQGQVADYKETVSFIKREMGKEYAKPAPFPNGLTPVEISARILRKLVEDANAVTHDSCRDVVITCPAYFGTLAREQTKQAGKIAGLNVLRIINEPTAAAIAYGAETGKDDDKDRYVLVYDLGGGTFDVSMIRIKGRVMEVLGTGGDRRLGGYDWDRCLAEKMLAHFNRTNRTSWSFKDRALFNDFMLKAEETKKMLSERAQCKIVVAHKGKGADFAITRKEFDSWTSSLLEKTIELTRECLEDVRKNKGVTIDSDTKVLLVGGSSRMPQVKERLTKFFQKYGCSIQIRDPDQCVAKGAAVTAHKEYVEKYEPSAKPAIILQDVTSKSYGVKCLDLEKKSIVIEHLIFRNQTLPLQEQADFYTIQDNQREVEIHIYESNSGEPTIPVEEGTPLDIEHSLPLPPGLPENTTITVHFELGEEGILQVNATAAGSAVEFPVKLVSDMTPAELNAAKQELANSKIE